MTRIVGFLTDWHDAMHADFCPSINRWVYWMKHPLACLGLAAVISLACGVLINTYSFALFGILIAVAGLGIAWPRIAVSGLICEAAFERSRARPGELVPVRLTIRNRWPWPVWGLSLRRGFVPEDRSSAGVALARVNGWSLSEFVWDFRPTSRGVFPSESPQIDTGFPFGLLHATAPLRLQGELLVWPQSIPLEGMPDAAEIHSREERFAERRVGECGDILGTRPFRDGDSLRRVHWRQTARYGRMIVSERQAPAMCAVRLKVDVSESSHAHAAGTLESSLSVAASIAEGLHRQHAYVEALIGDELIPVGASAADLRRLLDSLARVPAKGIHSGHSHACPLDRKARHLTTITVTTERAFTHHVAHRHGAAAERFVIVREHERQMHAGDPVAGCHCHAWLEVMEEESLATVLPARWRRACDVT